VHWGWCGRTLAWSTHHRFTPVGCWLGLDCFHIGGLLLGSFALFCFTLSYVAPFDYFSMYLVYMSSKTLSIQYMWKYVNSKGIYVESLFISPVLDIN
jgi:hypothetical protein